MRFLAILQVSPTAEANEVREVQEREQAIIQAGEWEIRAELDTQKPPALTIRHFEGKSTFLYRDQQPARIQQKTGGASEDLIAVKIMPWHLKQSLLQHRR